MDKTNWKYRNIIVYEMHINLFQNMGILSATFGLLPLHTQLLWLQR